MDTIVITGGAGFIGVHAARSFARAGYAVIIFDNFSRKGTELNVQHLLADAPQVEVVRGDIVHDRDLLASVIGRADVVLHLAAQVAVTTSVVDPRSDFEINALGTFNVLEAIRQSERKPFLINASTNKVFGALEHYPVRENESRYEFIDDAFRTHGVPSHQPLDFHSPYGCSKGAADQYVVDYGRIYGLQTVTFRQSCIYGTHQFGVEDQGWLAWFTIAILLQKQLTIYGTGKQVRDALFVDDLIALYHAAIKRRDQLHGAAYVVGGGPQNTVSLAELLPMLSQKLGREPNMTRGDIRPGDQPIFVADIRDVERDFAWAPTVGVDEGVDRMVQWIREHEGDIRTLFGV